MTDRLSVCLLCWNHRDYLEDCINALAAQSDQDFEIVMLDNRSTDGSVEFARSLFTRADIKATVFVNDSPQSTSANFNKLAKLANGTLLCFLSTDDFYESHYVAVMRAAVNAHHEAGWFSCGGWHLQQETGERTQIDMDVFKSRCDIKSELLAGREPFFFVGMCYRRSALASVNGWDENIPIEDADLFFRLAGKFPHHAVPSPLVVYRKHGGGASSNPAFMIDALEKFYAKHRKEYGRRRLNRHRSEMLRTYAALYADRGERAAAIRTALRSLTLRPLSFGNWQTFIYALRTTTAGGQR
ncbi:MAG: glycosyltransferase [Burkholderiales bacterium]|nr:glycosyltransferase [Phycisphaerae bacterium]